MQAIKILHKTLSILASKEHCLFSLTDLRGIIPGQNQSAFKSLISRAQKTGILERVCRGIYLYPGVTSPDGHILYRVAARTRAGEFNYISLETVLSDSGAISQIPFNWITLMSSGRSYVIDCGKYGHVEFIHTKKTPAKVASQLFYDEYCGLWRASPALAMEDMKYTRRSTELVDQEVLSELIR